MNTPGQLCFPVITLQAKMSLNDVFKQVIIETTDLEFNRVVRAGNAIHSLTCGLRPLDIGDPGGEIQAPKRQCDGCGLRESDAEFMVSSSCRLVN